MQHFLSGVASGGASMEFGVEDLTDWGDADFEDLLFTVTRLEDELILA